MHPRHANGARHHPVLEDVPQLTKLWLLVRIDLSREDGGLRDVLHPPLDNGLKIKTGLKKYFKRVVCGRGRDLRAGAGS